MTKPRTNAGWLAVMLLVIVLLPVGYMGAYYSLVDPQTYLRIGLPSVTYAEYRIGGDASKVLFWPAHQCDRAIRPNYWPACR